MHFRVIFDIYQSDGKQKRNQEGLFDQIGEKKEEEEQRTYIPYYIYRHQKFTICVLSLPPTLFLKRMLSYHLCRLYPRLAPQHYLY